jgi:hypothetical protein
MPKNPLSSEKISVVGYMNKNEKKIQNTIKKEFNIALHPLFKSFIFFQYIRLVDYI